MTSKALKENEVEMSETQYINTVLHGTPLLHRYDIVHNIAMTAPTVDLEFDIVVLDRIAVKKIIHQNSILHHKISDSLQTKIDYFKSTYPAIYEDKNTNLYMLKNSEFSRRKILQDFDTDEDVEKIIVEKEILVCDPWKIQRAWN